MVRSFRFRERGSKLDVGPAGAVILAHLADLHLGYRAYARAAPGGSNVRELDVLRAFGRAVDLLAGIQPDAILVAGDVFHGSRPSNLAITTAFREFVRLRAMLPGTPVVVVAGAHDSPASPATGSILELLDSIPGITVAEGESPRVVRLARPDIAVHCIPHAAWLRGLPASPAPDPTAGVNVLLAHAPASPAPDGRPGLDTAVLDRPGWDYVALGGEHRARRVRSNAWYPGAIERTGADIWAEAGEVRGFLSHDMATGRTRFHAIAGREVIDLKPIDAAVADGARRPASELDELIARAVDAVEGGIDGKVVRLVVRNVSGDVVRGLDHGAIRSWNARALHFHLDMRPPSGEGDHAREDGERRRASLEEEVDRFLDAWRPRSDGIRPDRLKKLARTYLDMAADGADGEGTP